MVQRYAKRLKQSLTVHVVIQPFIIISIIKIFVVCTFVEIKNIKKMKINVQVDLSDFYNEEEESKSFNDQIKDYISWNVKNEVLKDFKEKAFEELTTEIKKHFNSCLKEEISKIVTNVFKESKVKSQSNSNDKVTYFEFIESEMQRTYERPDSNAKQILFEKFDEFRKKYDKEMSETANTIVKDLKERYDVLFASQIVSKLGENGLMNPEAVKLLLDK